MPLPLNWSERVESPGVTGLHDCSYAAALDLLVAAGHRQFPLGIYSPEERNALETFDNRKDNTGATPDDILMAVKRRYGVNLHVYNITTQSKLLADLAKPGRAWSVSGRLSFFPAGDPLRDPQPNFTGGHQVCWVTLPDGNVLWLDPLRENKSPGLVIPASKAVKFAWTNWRALYLDVDELGKEIDMHIRPVHELWVFDQPVPYWTEGPDVTYNGSAKSWTQEPDGYIPATKAGDVEVTNGEEWRQDSAGDWGSGAWRTYRWKPGTPGHTSIGYIHRLNIKPIKLGGIKPYDDLVTDIIFNTKYDTKTNTVSNPRLGGISKDELQSQVRAAARAVAKGAQSVADNY